MTNQMNMFICNFSVGDRVQAHPACDVWMAGDRFGEVVKIGRVYVHVKMDRSGRIRKFVPENLLSEVP